MPFSKCSECLHRLLHQFDFTFTFRHHLLEKLHLCIVTHLPWKKDYLYSWLLLSRNLSPLLKYKASRSLHVIYHLPYLLPVQREISSKWMPPHRMQGKAQPQQLWPKNWSSYSRTVLAEGGKQRAAVTSYIPADIIAGCMRLLFIFPQHKDKVFTANLFNCIRGESCHAVRYVTAKS